MKISKNIQNSKLGEILKDTTFKRIKGDTVLITRNNRRFYLSNSELTIVNKTLSYIANEIKTSEIFRTRITNMFTLDEIKLMENV